MIFIPELEVKKLLDNTLRLIREDIGYTYDPTSTFLYSIVNGIKVDKFDLYKQAKELFSRTTDHPRCVKTNLFFDSNRAILPTIHLSLPSENTGNLNGIGVDNGYIYDDEGNTTHTRSFSCEYRLIFTSDNTMEVITMYHTVRAYLEAILDSVELEGFINLKFGGYDLQVNNGLIPSNIFLRALTLHFDYQVTVKKIDLPLSFLKETPITNIEFDSTIYTY